MTFEDLVTGYQDDYKLQGYRSLDSAAKPQAAHLRRFFQFDRALDITKARIRAYQVHRRAEGAAAATINRETSALARMFRIAIENELLSTMPAFLKALRENPPRQGFFERAEYLAVREHLPTPYQDVLDFAFYSGWRRREITRLTWVEVNLARSEILLDAARSKTGRPRALPLSDPLLAVIRRRSAVGRVDVRWVFHWNGRPIGDWRKCWNEACRKAGYPGKHLHDCRRTAARNLRQAGVPEDVAMQLTGHATRDVFRRYAIIVYDDLRSGVEQLASYVKAQPTKPTVQPLSRRGAR